MTGAALVGAVTMGPGAAHAADVPIPVPPVVVSTGSGLVANAFDAVDAAKKTACTPQGAKSNFDTWSGELRAVVNTDPLRPQIQYVWNTYDGSVNASAYGYVPDTGCAQGVRVVSQITDTSAAHNCEPVVQSQAVTAYGHDHWTLDDGTKVLVGANPEPFQLPVTYYGDDGSGNDVTARVDESVPAAESQEFAPYCIRETSTVTVKSTGYYLNNLNQFVWFACEMDEYQIVAKPTGPRINYIETVPC